MRKISLLVVIVSITLMMVLITIRSTTDSFVLPHDLQDCEILTIRKGDLSSTQINIIRCPKDKEFQYTYMGTHSTYSQGKTSASSKVVFQ
jgi:cytochrome c-type biogenesis protein CcmE